MKYFILLMLISTSILAHHPRPYPSPPVHFNYGPRQFYTPHFPIRPGIPYHRRYHLPPRRPVFIRNALPGLCLYSQPVPRWQHQCGIQPTLINTCHSVLTPFGPQINCAPINLGPQLSCGWVYTWLPQTISTPCL